jgi:hypothetical protein
MSIQKRRDWRKRTFNSFFEYVDKNGNKAVGKGRKYVVDAIEVELFPSSVLCGMLGRQLRTLYGWERDFGFPMALWQIREDTNTKRWYSRKQLIFIRALYEANGCLKGKHKTKLAQFIAAVNSRFYTIDAPPTERKSENVTLLEGR